MSVRMEAFVLDFCMDLSQNVQKGGIKEFCMFIGWFERLYCETIVICIENQQCILCGFAMMKKRFKKNPASCLNCTSISNSDISEPCVYLCMACYTAYEKA